MNFKSIFLLDFISLLVTGTIVTIQEVEILTHTLREDSFKLSHSKILVSSAENVKGVIDDDDFRCIHLEIYDVAVQSSRKKVATILDQFWNDAKMQPIKIRASFEVIEFTLKKPKNAEIVLNQLANNAWSILIYINDKLDVLEIKFRIPDNHENDEFLNMRMLLEFS